MHYHQDLAPATTGLNWPLRDRPHRAFPLPLLDEAALGELEVLGTEVLTNILQLYAAEAARDSAELRDAVQLVDMRRLGRAAHRLKGASCVVGAAQVVAITQEIETLASAGSTPTANALLTELATALQQTNEAFRERIADGPDTPTQGTQ